MNYLPRTSASDACDELPVNALMRDWAMTRPNVSQIAVWDIGVRMFHWLLVGTVLSALITGYFSPRHWLMAEARKGFL